jgi:GNAT superfamily N-acetyltransferase
LCGFFLKLFTIKDDLYIVDMNITFHLIKNLVHLQVVASNCFRDLSVLANIVNPSSKPVTQESLTDFFEHNGVLVIACDEESIVGVACLIRSYKFNGYSFRLEHVATLPSHQKRGIAGKLIGIANDHAFIKGDGYIDLTCEPHRVQANSLYERFGYTIRDTNLRRLRFNSTR